MEGKGKTIGLHGDGSVREVMWCQEAGHRGLVTERCVVDDDVRMEIDGSMLTLKVATKLRQEWHQACARVTAMSSCSV